MHTLLLGENDDLTPAAASLKQGGLVVFPTETVYGLGAHALDRRAVLSIFAAKGRPADNPLIVHIPDSALLSKLAVRIPPLAERLWAAFSPGPLTLVLERHPAVPAEVSGGLDTIALRIPSHPVALRLLRECGLPLAAPSANHSGRPSPTDFTMACAAMQGRVAAIIDGGPCHLGLESTVVRCLPDRLIILRPGAVSREMLQKTAGVPVTMLGEQSDAESGLALASPGTHHPHYRPRAEVLLLPDDSEQWGEILQGRSLHTAALLCLAAQSVQAGWLAVREFGSVEEYAREFYRSLEDMDRQGAALIVCAPVPQEGIGHALMNRMLRSAGRL